MCKSCMICKHFTFMPGEPDLSDDQPGFETSAECQLDHWYEDSGSFVDWQQLGFEHAAECGDFEACDRKP